MYIDPVADANLLRRLADTCPGCGLHRVVNGRCTQCGTDKVIAVYKTFEDDTPSSADVPHAQCAPALAGGDSKEPALSHVTPMVIGPDDADVPATATVTRKRKSKGEPPDQGSLF